MSKLRAAAWAGIGALAVLAFAGLAYLRAQYEWRDMFVVLWHLALHLSLRRLAAALLASGLLLFLVTRWRSAAHQAYPALFAYMLGVLADAALLFLLDPLGISSGPVLIPLALLAAARFCLALGLGLLAWLLGRRTRQRAVWPWLHVAGQVLIFALVIDGFAIEPMRITVTRVSVADPYHSGGQPMRIVQISDLHIEHTNSLDTRCIDTVNALQPDIIVLTGDILNTSFYTDPQALADFRTLIGRLRAGTGIYAVRGNVDTPDLARRAYQGLPVTLLEDRWVDLTVKGRPVALAGIATHEDLDLDRRALARVAQTVPRRRLDILLYHTPDLIPEAAAAGFNLLMAGHTHGGQIRLPLYGALTTFSAYGKRYEMGAYREGQLLAYVSRGVGMEGWLVPRMRFLCPPEVVCYDIE
jgi:uncharacterized protein